MTFLQDITKAEHQAQKRIDAARIKTTKQIAQAEAKENDEIEVMRSHMQESREKALLEARKKADAYGRSLVEDAHKEINRLEEVCRGNKKRATNFILESL